MEHLLNQARRVRFSGQEEPRSARERSSLKTVSFKDAAQNKGPQNCTSKRFSGKVPKPELPPTSNPATPPTRRAKGDGTDADAWERAELSKIQRRHEKMKGTILSWENKRKEKAKKRIRKTEGDLDKIRSTALKQFHDDMVDIGQIAGGARAKAEERQRNEEFKAKEKANTIRKTGKLPRTCFCF
ncbi:REMORIN FAMILY PROTEIN [Salix viminalis]|uniref:REMORIN FAMILY PROTEIN n=1 Tax=Salix viminalis TaxID=40686 RepID=A0A9Q0Z4B4_SALVM|nr:REMORIN FAMILY PROTEIN [Salix viminalis]